MLMLERAMHAEHLDTWTHSHTFGTDERRSAERRTWWVIGLTTAMMTVEIGAGAAFGSMARTCTCACWSSMNSPWKHLPLKRRRVDR